MQSILIFDLGKVIIDFSWERTIENIRSKLPADYDLEFSHFTKHEDLFRYERGEIDTDTYCKSMSQELHGSITPAEFQEAFDDIFLGIFEGIDSFLDELKTHYKIVALTNINDLHYKFILKNYGSTLSKFEKIYASHEMQCRKPEVKIYEKVLADLNVPAHKCIYLDDMSDNIETAQQLGFRCIHVTDPTKMQATLREELKWDFI